MSYFPTLAPRAVIPLDLVYIQAQMKDVDASTRGYNHEADTLPLAGSYARYPIFSGGVTELNTSGHLVRATSGLSAVRFVFWLLSTVTADQIDTRFIQMSGLRLWIGNDFKANITAAEFTPSPDDKTPGSLTLDFFRYAGPLPYDVMTPDSQHIIRLSNQL